MATLEIICNEKDNKKSKKIKFKTKDDETIQVYSSLNKGTKKLEVEIPFPAGGEPPIDKNPTAYAGEDLNTIQNQLVDLNGSAKDDGTIVSGWWTGPESIKIEDDATSFHAHFTTPTLLENETARSLVFTFHAKDNSGKEATDQAIVTVFKDPHPTGCPEGQHKDENGNCVPDELPSGKINVSKLWSNNHPRRFTSFDPDDNKVQVRADGNTECFVDGNGNCNIIGDRRRIYPYYNNYDARLTFDLVAAFSGSGDDCSIHLRSRHNEKPKPTDPKSLSECSGEAFGGYGFSVSKNGWDAKREPEHNFHDQSHSGGIPKPIENGKKVKVAFTVKDEGGKVHQIGEIDYLDGNGFQKVADWFDNNPEKWMVDRAKYDAKSYFWIRNNGSGSITVSNVQLEPLN